MTFKDNFRQGKVIGIDLKNHTVLLQGGEVSVCVGGCPGGSRPPQGQEEPSVGSRSHFLLHGTFLPTKARSQQTQAEGGWGCPSLFYIPDTVLSLYISVILSPLA